MDNALLQKRRSTKPQSDQAEKTHGDHSRPDRSGGGSAGMPLFLQRQVETSLAEEEQQELEEEEVPQVQAKLVVGARDDPYEQEADDAAKAVVQRSAAPDITPLEEEEEVEELGVQAKLTVGAPDDDYEREADQVAEVVRRKVQPQEPAKATTTIQSSRPSSPAAIHSPSAGVPLSSPIRDQVEPVLQTDFSDVRIHHLSADRELAKSLQAKAFTHQNHIWLGDNQSPEDVELMAHELTHVSQQTAASGSGPTLQRQPVDTASIQDGELVRLRMQHQIEAALGVHAPAPRTNASPSETGTQTSVPALATARPELIEAERSLDRTEVTAQAEQLQPYARPEIDRSAEQRPLVEQAAQETSTAIDREPPPLEAQSQDEAAPPATTATSEAGQDAVVSADQAASLVDQSFGSADAQAMPLTPPSLRLPEPAAAVDAAGIPLPADPDGEAEVTALAEQTQRLRDQGFVFRQQASQERANAHILRGNIGLVQAGIEQSQNGVQVARGNVNSRRSLLNEARQALAVSEEKAATVAAQAPEGVSRSGQERERSSPMARRARELVGENQAHTPSDPEAAQNAQEQGSRLNQVGSDTHTIDSTIAEVQEAAGTLVQDAEHATEVNSQTQDRLDSTEETLTQTEDTLGQMQEQNSQARSQLGATLDAPAILAAQAEQLDQEGMALISISEQMESQLISCQNNYAKGMNEIPAPETLDAEEGGAEEDHLIQRNHEAGATSQPINLGAGLPSWLTGVREVNAEQRQQRFLAQQRQRQSELRFIASQGDVSQMGAGERRRLAMRLLGRRISARLSGVSWPSFGSIARGAGHLAVALIDPRTPLMGVINGINTIVNGVARFVQEPSWGNGLRLAADVATGITIVLGSITALAAVIIAIMAALSIVSFGTLAPVTGPVIAFCSTVMTTVGGWTVYAGLIAAGLQALVFVKDLYLAGTAETADHLIGHTDRMSEDATAAGGALLQAGVGRLAQVGGRHLQSSIAEAGGGVRFAAGMGARAAPARVARGVQHAGGVRAYARGVGAGARETFSQLGERVASAGGVGAFSLQTAAGAARRVGRVGRFLWHQFRTGGPGTVSTRQGFSRNFLIGEGIPKGAGFAGLRAAATTTRMNVMIDELVTRGVPITAPSPTSLARARAAFDAGRATPQDLRTLIQQAVADSRAYIQAAKGSTSLPHNIVKGCCGPGRDVSATSLGAMAMDSPTAMLLRRFQSLEVFGVGQHGFSVVTFPGNPPTRFLIDPTFSQFMRRGWRTAASTDAPAQVIRGHVSGSTLARDLARDGFIPLTPENAALYARAMGASESNAAALGQRLFGGRLAVTEEVIGAPSAPLAAGTHRGPIASLGHLGASGPDVIDLSESLRFLREHMASVRAAGDPGNLLPSLGALERRLTAAQASLRRTP